MASSGNDLRFDGRVVVVTGAGAGLGRAYALLFGSRGASVVVNDLGVNRSGVGQCTKAADAVVNEIVQSGGKATADYNSVLEGHKIIKTALDAYGRVDVVVNNAGILRDKSFARISNDDWDQIHNVHLKGSFITSQAAWPIFRQQKYGKIILTSSNSGLYGNFGQANYSAAKMGLVGLCNTIAIEGRNSNISCNVIVPTAASRLTEDILPPELLNELKPELIAPVVVWLCHEKCEESGVVIESAAGWAAKYGLVRSLGTTLRHKLTDTVTPEDVCQKWREVTDMEITVRMSSIQEATASLMEHLDKMRQVTSAEAKEVFTHLVTFKDCILYALGIGARAQDPSDIKYLYENHEQFSAFPTMAIIPGQMAIASSSIMENLIPGKSVDLTQILHGEQYLEIFQPMPSEGRLDNVCKIVDVLDKGSNAIILVGVDTYDVNGSRICYGQMSIVAVGAGGFGGKRDTDKNIDIVDPPNRKPDASEYQTTSHDQAALYRLSGDLNPLHIDANFASLGGFKMPILHGLCSLGFSARHVLKRFGNNDPTNFRAIKCRFSKPVIPGESLRTDMWASEGFSRIHFRTVAVESGNIIISGAYVDLQKCYLRPINSVKVETLSSDIVFQTMSDRIKNTPELVKKINGIFTFNITENGTVVKTWTCDLKRAEVYEGNPKVGVKVDTTITLGNNDFIELALGKLNPQLAFQQGKLKIKGNIMLIQKLRGLMSFSKY